MEMTLKVKSECYTPTFVVNTTDIIAVHYGEHDDHGDDHADDDHADDDHADDDHGDEDHG